MVAIQSDANWMATKNKKWIGQGKNALKYILHSVARSGRNMTGILGMLANRECRIDIYFSICEFMIFNSLIIISILFEKAIYDCNLKDNIEYNFPELY